ncbi:unnamed protein product [Caenorhabditis angaria]|uniref:Reverse transcriptase domain-containing protein n=1 Tax=Caenorhabditis angaria TaxID=860376 RepID=A0A9P1I9E1_9PELO|nr:unnamed protein product [Caenorhabditis angaria]
MIGTLNDWTLGLENREQVDIIYFDYSKAFDKVKIGECFSTKKLCSSGVPQGGVLSPLLFAIFVNDLPSYIPQEIKIKQFADDVKIYSIIKNLQSSELLQRAINQIILWSSENQLTLNETKTIVTTVAIPMNYLYYDAKNLQSGEKINADLLPIKTSDGKKYKTCSKNADCDESSYCGHAINFAVNRKFAGVCEYDQDNYCSGIADCNQKEHCLIRDLDWLHVEPRIQFCYLKPAATIEKITDIQIQIRAKSTAFKICDGDADCQLGDDIGYCYKGDMGQGKKKWTIYQKDPNSTVNLEKPGFRVHKSGICMEAKPISFTLYPQFKKLSDADQLGSKGLRFMAVGWGRKNYIYRDEMITCGLNGNCAEDQFCDRIYHPQLGFDDNNKYCFKKPAVPADANSPVQFTAPGLLLGLVACDETFDCRKHGTDGNSFCRQLGRNQWKYARFDNGTVRMFSGLCMEGLVCTKPNQFGENFKWKAGGIAKNQKCTTNSECEGGGNTKDGENAKEVFENICIRNKPFNLLASCCYRQTKKCAGNNSKVIFPEKRCGNNAECYGSRDAKLRDKWCDLSSNQCCQNASPDAFCPDGQVPLYAEAECEDAESGTCGKHAVCKFGHCCAKASIANGKVVKPEFSYITSQPCTPGSLPSQFSAGYCDPKSKKIVIIGLKSPKGIPLKKSPETPKLCQKDTDCSSDNSVLCLRENSKDPEAYCYLDPLNEPDDGEKSIITIIIIIIGVILVIALGGIGGVLYYLRRKRKAAKKEEKTVVNKARSKPKSISKSKTSSKSKNSQDFGA